jgi:hypothetical protein
VVFAIITSSATLLQLLLNDLSLLPWMFLRHYRRPTSQKARASAKP